MTADSWDTVLLGTYRGSFPARVRNGCTSRRFLVVDSPHGRVLGEGLSWWIHHSWEAVWVRTLGG